jgi:hypothetical protein
MENPARLERKRNCPQYVDIFANFVHNSVDNCRSGKIYPQNPRFPATVIPVYEKGKALIPIPVPPRKPEFQCIRLIDFVHNG